MYETLRRYETTPLLYSIITYTDHSDDKVISFLCRRNINPSSLDGETDRGPPHVPHPSLRKHHPFELPVGSITERIGKAVIIKRVS